jgi:hypothetical protein
MQLAPYKVVGGSLGLGGITVLLAPLDFYPLALATGAVGLGLIVGVANRAGEQEGLATLALALALCLGALGVGLYGFNKAQDRDHATLIDPGPESPAPPPNQAPLQFRGEPPPERP